MSAAAPAMKVADPVRIPPLGLAAALLLWGIANELWPYALLMAVVLEGSRWVPWRWHLSEKDFNRISDATGLGFVLVVIYVFDTFSFQGVYVILKWLPFVFFLLAVAQRYSTNNAIRYAALFLSVRRAEQKGTVIDGGQINFDLPYLVTCLLSATGGEINKIQLFIGLSLMLGYLLWYNRPKRFSLISWFCVLILAIGIGYLNQLGLLKLRRIVEPAMMDFFRDRIMGWRDPFQSYTAMGHIGRLKQSDRIVLRVVDEDGKGVPSLLREATYRNFSKNIWMAGGTEFQAQSPDIEGTTWALENVPVEGTRRVRVYRSLIRGKGMLVVPSGTVQIERLPVEELERHPLGALKVIRGPGLINYTARFVPGDNFELPPEREDLIVPGDLEQLMAKVIGELGLEGAPPEEALRRIYQFFMREFSYSVTLLRPRPVATPLHGFLLDTRTGHCEFFASATVIMLRALGIPARYATGYSVQEFSPLEESFVVRRRHAHSWALAHVGGRWIDFDTTPPGWADMEARNAPWWEDIYDLGAWLTHQFSRWRWGGDEDDQSNQLLWLVVPLFVILVWRLSRTERVLRRPGSSRRGAAAVDWPGAESELYELLRMLEKRGLKRTPGEPLSRWFGSLREEKRLPGTDEIVQEMLPIHYRFRFDPRGISATERETLRRKVRDWITRHPA